MTNESGATAVVAASRLSAPDDEGPGRTPGRRPVVLVAGADEIYAPHLAVSLFSALSRIPRDRAAAVWVIDGGVTAGSLARIRATLARAHPAISVTILRPDLDALPEARPSSAWITRATLLRLLIPSLLPPSVDRALYLDADTVVVEDVSPLFDMDLDGRPLWAAIDADAEHEFRRLSAAGLVTGEAGPAAYFNAGVLLMDLPACRRVGLGPRALDLIAAHADTLTMADQDALNIAAAGVWGRLPDRWNNQITDLRPLFPDLVRRGRVVGVVHWLGRRKPWTPGRGCLRSEVYVAALARSGWHAPGALAALRVRRARDAAVARLRAWLRPLKRALAGPRAPSDA
jgi:lipopolysaccharide biosynthesis glycosyltransferase